MDLIRALGLLRKQDQDTKQRAKTIKFGLPRTKSNLKTGILTTMRILMALPLLTGAVLGFLRPVGRSWSTNNFGYSRTTKFLRENEEDKDCSILSAESVYFDIAITGIEVGRLVFHLENPSPLPKHAENLIQLAKGSRRGIDPKAHYVGCEFDFSPSSIEDGMGRYRWGHQLRGRGRNAIGGADEQINDPDNQLKHTHSCYGGQYYGVKYFPGELDQGDPGVFLAVPVLGPGRGTSKFSIVRVGESPAEWGERLLVNAGVIGKMDPSSLDVLKMMARQREGPPTVVGAGVL